MIGVPHWWPVVAKERRPRTPPQTETGGAEGPPAHVPDACKPVQPASREPCSLIADLARIDVRSVAMEAGTTPVGAGVGPLKTSYQALAT